MNSNSQNIEDFKKSFFEIISESNNIVITSHTSPDDDSVGSVLLMRSILTQKYPSKNIRIIYTGQKVERYSIFKNFETIEWVDDISDHVESFDTLIMLDSSNWRRFSKSLEKLSSIPKTIAIDHHASVPDEYTLLFKDESACANTELMYQIFFNGSEYTKEEAEYLLLGINGDTGGFAYIEPNKAGVFILIKELIEKVGISVDLFRSRYMGIPHKIIPLLQELVKNTKYQTIESWPPVQFSFIKETKGYSDEEVSAASHIYMSQYLTRVEGYSWGFVITSREDNTCRMSGRSLPGSVDVRAFHEALGIGSGHVRASGGYFKEADPEICLEKVLEFMKNNKPVLS
jgi:phosphoesterase RecJ-like protein